MKMKLKSLNLLRFFVTLFFVGVIVFPGWTSAAERIETAKIGACAPLTGPAATWGQTALDAIQIWAEDVNSKGGIKTGNKRILIEVIPADNKAMPSAAMTAARKLILKDKVVFIASFLMGDVIAPFCNKHKVLQGTIIARNIRKNLPYTIAMGNGDPDFQAFTQAWVMEDLYPNAKRVALTSQNDKDGDLWRAMYRGSTKTAGGKIVYDKPFSLDTMDFAPVVAAMLASKPDLLCWGGTYPAFTTLLSEQARIQGFRGPITTSSWDLRAVKAKVGVEGVEGYSSCWPDWNDPMYPDRAHYWFDKFAKKRGAQQWQGAGAIFFDMAYYWQQAVEMAGTTDPTAVRDVLLSGKELLSNENGPASNWYGQELYGCNHYILPKKWGMMVVHNGKRIGQGYYNLEKWAAKYTPGYVKELKAAGLMYYQRK